MAAAPLLGSFVGAHQGRLARNCITTTLSCLVRAHQSALMSNRNAATLSGFVGAHQGALIQGLAFLLSPPGAHNRARRIVAAPIWPPPRKARYMSCRCLHGRHFTTQKWQPRCRNCGRRTLPPCLLASLPPCFTAFQLSSLPAFPLSHSPAFPSPRFPFISTPSEGRYSHNRRQPGDGHEPLKLKHPLPILFCQQNGAKWSKVSSLGQF